MIAKSILFVLGLLGSLTSASVTVRKTAKGPTGYEVDFHYFNATAKNVTIGGGFTTFTDAYHATAEGSASYDPRNYKPGWFRGSGNANTPADLPFHMVSNGKGNWTYTTPLPSGTYLYAFLVDCGMRERCNRRTGKYIIDPDNLPFANVPGDQINSVFQVPFDATFQYHPDINLNLDFALPVNESNRGTVSIVNYTSPGSVHPAPDVHEFTLYLPKEYGTIKDKKYPVLYISHGGGGNGQEWENLMTASHILDRLILEKHIPPTVAVMPSMYNLAKEYKNVYSEPSNLSDAPSAPYVRQNYMQYLFPWVESHYAVSTNASQRAFAGLSMGGMLTYEMYINATSYFDYYGMFSGALGPRTAAGQYINNATLAKNPSFSKKGVFTAVGVYDGAFPDIRNFQTALQNLQLPFVSRITPYGYHQWLTWQDNLWHFGQTVLWKPLPMTANPVKGPSKRMVGPRHH